MSNKKIESIARAVQVAAQMFSEKAFEKVQIAEIAARSRCSSATIYEAFETKKGLHRAAMLQYSRRAWPNLAQNSGPPTLFHLMDFLSERISGLSTPTMHNFWRSVGVDMIDSRTIMWNPTQQTKHLGAIVDEVQRCMDAGLLRRGDPQAFAYLILAGGGYEPVVYSLLFGPDATGGAAAILEAVLSPLVTELGQAELTAYVNKSKTNGAPEGAVRPSLLGDLRSLPARGTSPGRREGASPAAETPATSLLRDGTTSRARTEDL